MAFSEAEEDDDAAPNEGITRQCVESIDKNKNGTYVRIVCIMLAFLYTVKKDVLNSTFLECQGDCLSFTHQMCAN